MGTETGVTQVHTNRELAALLPDPGRRRELAARSADPADVQAAVAWSKLTRRERDVAALMAVGYDNGQIALILAIRLQVVKNYASAIYSRCGMTSRVGLAVTLMESTPMRATIREHARALEMS